MQFSENTRSLSIPVILLGNFLDTLLAELENQLQKINTKNKQIKKETDDKYSKLLEEAIAQMNEKFEILAEENDRLNDILSSSSEKS